MTFRTVSIPASKSVYFCVGMTVMAKVVTTLDICENAKLARDLALAGDLFIWFIAYLCCL